MADWAFVLNSSCCSAGSLATTLPSHGFMCPMKVFLSYDGSSCASHLNSDIPVVVLYFSVCHSASSHREIECIHNIHHLPAAGVCALFCLFCTGVGTNIYISIFELHPLQTYRYSARPTVLCAIGTPEHCQKQACPVAPCLRPRRKTRPQFPSGRRSLISTRRLRITVYWLLACLTVNRRQKTLGMYHSASLYRSAYLPAPQDIKR